MKYLFLTPLLLFAACQSNGPVPDNTPDLRPLSSSEISVSDAAGDFGFNLFKKLNSASAENTLISPLSVSTALAMALNGAAGETHNGILQTIDYAGYDSAGVDQAYATLSNLLTHMDRTVALDLANSAWYRNDLTVRPSFDSVITASFDGTVQGLDFGNPGSLNTLNDWVASKTGNHINKLITHLDDSDLMILINAIYFKGTWKYRFDKSKTHTADFHLENGDRTSVNMMVLPERSLPVMTNEEVQLVDLPYGNGQFTMTLMLPQDGKTTSEIVNGLSSEEFNAWLSQIDSTNVEVDLPRFTMNWKKKLNDELASMGMARAFSDDAEFPHIFENPLPLAITEVNHAAYIEVNEEGTEAAAATSVSIGETSAPLPARIVFDRPFLFFIRERHSGVILFIGELANPQG